MENMFREATRDRENRKILTKEAFGKAKFHPKEAEHTLKAPVTGTVKEEKYIKGNTMVRFVMYDREGTDFYFQYHVFSLEDEEIQNLLDEHAKKLATHQAKENESKKEKPIKKKVSKPIEVKIEEKPKEILIEQAEDVKTSVEEASEENFKAEEEINEDQFALELFV